MDGIKPRLKCCLLSSEKYIYKTPSEVQYLVQVFPDATKILEEFHQYKIWRGIISKESWSFSFKSSRKWWVQGYKSARQVEGEHTNIWNLCVFFTCIILRNNMFKSWRLLCEDYTQVRFKLKYTTLYKCCWFCFVIVMLYLKDFSFNLLQ